MTAASSIGGTGTGNTLSGMVSGAYLLTKVGTGSITLSNNSNDYTGGTTISAGTLTAGAIDAFYTSGALNISSGATLGVSFTSGSLGNTITLALSGSAAIADEASSGTATIPNVITLAASSTPSFGAASGSILIFSSTINGPSSGTSALSTTGVGTGAGTVEFNGTIGVTHALTSLTTSSTSGAATTIDTGTIDTTGSQTYNNPVTVTTSGATTFSASGSGSTITFGSSLMWSGANQLNITAGSGNIVFNGAVTNTTAGSTLALTAQNAAQSITTGSGGSIDVYNFDLTQGQWYQLLGQGSLASATSLPPFTIVNFGNFDLNSNSIQFLRAAGGTGLTSGSPYLITDEYGLQGIGSSATLEADYFQLQNNIYADGTNGSSSTQYWNSGVGFLPLGTFGAVFSGGLTSAPGNTYTISGIYEDQTSGGRNLGLIGTASTATISNIGVINASITMAATNGSGDFGILVGDITGAATLSGDYSAGSISSDDYTGTNLGGLVGLNDGGSITKSYNTAAVLQDNSTVFAAANSVGGLVGYNEAGSGISQSYNTGSVTDTGNSTGSIALNVGGLVGESKEPIANSYNQGNISESGTGGTISTGGLVGVIGAPTGTIATSYSVATISSNGSVGGFVGVNSGSAAFTNNYWDNSVSGGYTGNGTAAGNVSNITGESSSTMQTLGGFSGFDFSTPVWILPASNYPILLANPEGQLFYGTTTGITNGTGTIVLLVNGSTNAQDVSDNVTNNTFAFDFTAGTYGVGSDVLAYLTTGGHVGNAFGVVPSGTGSITNLNIPTDATTDPISIVTTTGSNSGLITASGGGTISGVLYTGSGANLTLGTGSQNITLSEASPSTTTYTADGSISTFSGATSTVNLGATNIDGNITTTSTSGQTYTGAVTVGGTGAVLSAGSAPIDFSTTSSTINGAEPLTLTTMGAITLDGNVGAITPLASLTVTSGSSSITLGSSATTIATSGSQTYNANNITLSASSAFTSSGGDINMGTSANVNTINGNSSVVLTLANGDATLGGSVIDNSIGSNISSLTISSASTGIIELEGTNSSTGGTTINGGSLAINSTGNIGTGTITLNNGSNAYVSGYGSLYNASGSPMTLTNTISVTGTAGLGSNAALTLGSSGAPTTISGGGSLTLVDNVAYTINDSINSLAALVSNGSTTFNTGTITTSGSQTYNSPVSVTTTSGTTAFTATGSGSTITFGNNLSWSTSNAVTISASSGNIVFDGNISGVNGSLTLTAQNAAESILPSATTAVDVNNFTLSAGDWYQIVSPLPNFTINNSFSDSGSFLRAISGSGTTLSPYLIEDVYGLEGMNGTSSYTLNNTIDASSTSNWANGFTAVNNAGTFNGNGYTISGLTGPAGLFASNSGTIENVGVVNAYVNSEYTGGILADDNTGTINDAFVSGSITAYNPSSMDVIYLGGLVGTNEGTITNVYSTASVSSSAGSDPIYMGGLVGANEADVDDEGSGSVNDAYVTGLITNTTAGYTGALIGENAGSVGHYGLVENSFWDTSTTNQSSAVGETQYSTITNVNGGTIGGSTNLGAESTYTSAGWNFSSVWTIVSGQYPTLQGVPLGLNFSGTLPGGVNSGYVYLFQNGVELGSPYDATSNAFTLSNVSGTSTGDTLLFLLASTGTLASATSEGVVFAVAPAATGLSDIAFTYASGTTPTITADAAAGSLTNTLLGTAYTDYFANYSGTAPNQILYSASGNNLTLGNSAYANVDLVMPNISYTVNGTIAPYSGATSNSVTFYGPVTIDNNITTAGAGGQTYAAAVTLGGTTTLNAGSGAIDFSTSNSTINGAQLLTLTSTNSSANAITIDGVIGGGTPLSSLIITSGSGGITLGSSATGISTSGAQTYNNNVINLPDAAVTLTSSGGNITSTANIVGDGSTLTIANGGSGGALSGVISDLTGLTSSGSGGTLTLSGANTYTGNTDVSAGTLAITTSIDALGTGTTATPGMGIIISSGATLELNLGGQQLANASTIELAGTGATNGALFEAGTHTDTLTNPIILTGNTTVFTFAGGTSGLSFTGTINLASNTLTFNGSGSGSIYNLSNNISGTGGSINLLSGM